MIERDIDCRKHRKSTHLASPDLDAMTLEGKDLIFEILDIWYETGVNVSGNKTDGYFCKLKGVKKDWVLNSINRDVLSSFAKKNGLKGADAYNIGNWKGLVIELYVDRNVKMMGKIVDGIRIKPIQPTIKKEKPIFTEDKIKPTFEKGITIEQIKGIYNISKEIETKYLEYGAKK